jgi:two-component system sensor histidine kinase YesM
MNKKQGYQGFRKFSIKTRLVIALLLISIIPLAGISGYSFHIFSVALREKLSASISQTLSMINLNMVSEIEKYQYLSKQDRAFLTRLAEGTTERTGF